MKDEPISASQAADLLEQFYPRIYLACHTRHVNDPGKDVRLTQNQASILDHLDEEEPVTLQELSLHMGVTPSTMSITINRLVTLGYVQRDKDKGDSRRVRLKLSKEGLKIKKSKSVLDSDRVVSMLKRLTEEELKTALKGLGLLSYAAELEMKSRSLDRAWANRSGKKKSN
ncbi:MAG TPA: MarR family transcriptional regulator [Cyclobacteriaceae bacterium]|nr:MarR family transcriptional regulator [Cyclobacteriaceae bacterium]